MLEKIEEKYLSKGIYSGSELFLDHKTSLEYIEDLKKEGYIILGADFFIIKGKAHIDTLNILDLSSIAKEDDAVQKSFEETKRFIENGFPENTTHATFVIRKAK